MTTSTQIKFILLTIIMLGVLLLDNTTAFAKTGHTPYNGIATLTNINPDNPEDSVGTFTLEFHDEQGYFYLSFASRKLVNEIFDHQHQNFRVTGTWATDSDLDNDWHITLIQPN